MPKSKHDMNVYPREKQIQPVASGRGENNRLRSFLQRFNPPAVIFLFITIILSATVFYLSMKSGVPKFSLPKLVELTPSNVTSLKEIHQFENNVVITSILFSPDGRFLAVARGDDILHVWSTEDYQLIYTFQTESFCTNCLAFSPDSHYLAAIREGRPYDVIVWDLETGKSFWESLGTLMESDENITGVEFSPDGRLLVGAVENTILFWEIDTLGFTLIREIVGHSDPIRSLAFSPNGQNLLTTSNDKTAKVWDVVSGNWLMTLSGHTDFVAQGIYSPDGSWIVTAGYDRTIRVWEANSGTLVKVLAYQSGPVISLAYSPDGKLLVSGTIFDQVTFWDGVFWNPLYTMDAYTGDVVPLAFSPDNKIFGTTNLEGTLTLWGKTK